MEDILKLSEVESKIQNPEFSGQNLESNSQQPDAQNPNLEKDRTAKKERKLRAIGIISGIILFLLFTFYFFIFRPAYAVYQKAMEITQTGMQLKEALANQNLEESLTNIKTLKLQIVALNKDYGQLQFFRYVPFVNKYYKDGEAGISAGNHGLIAGELLLTGIEPFASVFGFQTKSGADEEVSADQKLEELVKLMPQLLPSFDAALEELDEVEKQLQEIDPNDYPKKIKGYSIQDTLIQVKDTFTNGNKFAHDARPVLAKLPEAMGEPNPVNYLILFQNDKELRPTGGFITAYALVTMDRGRFKIIRSEDIYNIDHDESYLSAPDPIKRYLVPGLYMRDSNFSPDFQKSMQDFEVYYNHLSDFPKIEGIIAVDTEFVRSFMEVTGPLYIAEYGETFEAENIVYELELYSEKILSGYTRKDLLGKLMGEMVNKVFSSKKDQWRPLMNKGIEEMNNKHMLFYFHDEIWQNFAQEYNFAGRIKDYDGDYLHVNDANLGGLKSDYWVEREVNQKINIADDGTVTKEVAITFYNRGAYDGWLNAQTRTYTRIYVPLGSKLISSEGGDYGSNAEVSEDLGKTVFANFTRTSPLTSQTIKFTYELPFKLKGVGLLGKKDYKLMVQKQSGLGKPQPNLNRPKYTVEINGKMITEYELMTDNEFQWSL